MEYKDVKIGKIDKLAEEIARTALKGDLDPFDVMQAMGHAQVSLGMYFGLKYKTEEKDGEEFNEAIRGLFVEVIRNML